MPPGTPGGMRGANLKQRGEKKMSGKGSSTMQQDLSMGRGQAFVRLALGVVVTIFALGLWAHPASAATLFVSNACDLLVVKPGDGGLPGTLEAAPGDIVELTADSICVPSFDPATGELLSGDGIAIAAEGVTLDLKGFDIISDSNVAFDADAFGLDVENAGVSVGARNVTVRNTSPQVSIVENFTANFDYAKAESSSLAGLKVAGVFNIQIGESHGGGGIAVDRSKGITIDTVEIIDKNTDAVPAGGDNAIDWKRCTGNGNFLKNSHIVGPLAALRYRICPQGLQIWNTSFSTADPAIGVGIEFTRDVKNVTITGSDIGPNGETGVGIGPKTENIKLNPTGAVATRNTIHDNVVCGVEINPTAKNMQTDAQLLANNTFSANGIDVCR